MSKDYTIIKGVKIKKGSLLKIKDHAPNSWLVPEMKKYFGTIQQVSDISSTLPGVIMCGFSWNVKDVDPLIYKGDIKKRIKPVTFDENELLEGNNV